MSTATGTTRIVRIGAANPAAHRTGDSTGEGVSTMTEYRPTVPAQPAAFNTFRHEPHCGFCTICGSVWPCARGARAELALAALS